MKIMRIFFILLFYIGSTSVIDSQNLQFDTHKMELSGELTTDDAFEDNFGRFDAYQVQLQKGDFIKIKMSAQFFPLLTIVSPSGSYKRAFPTEGLSYVIHEQEIDETGHWYLYISGESTDIGWHILDMYYVSESTKSLSSTGDLCDVTQFSLAHSNTNFFYLRNRELEVIGDSWISNIEFDLFQDSDIKKVGNRIVLELKANSIGKNKFNEWSYKMSECLDYNWEEKSDETSFQFKEVNGSRKVDLKFNGSSVLLSISNLIEK